MRRDRRGPALVVTVVAVFVGGLLLRPAPTPPVDELQGRFDEGVLLLRSKHYAQAATAFERVLLLAPRLPEAHVDLGFALLGLQRHADARDAFDRATALRPGQANAYYGLALAYEAGGDAPMATGAMRSYLHLARNEDPEHLKRARAALWEWENQRAAVPETGKRFPDTGTAGGRQSTP